MTKQEIRTEVMSRMNLTSADAEARVDAAIDRHHKRITSLLGMETLRMVAVSVSASLGNRHVVVPGVEKLDRVMDVTNPMSRRLLREVSIHNIERHDPTTAAPEEWAMWSAGAAQVQIVLDTVPQVAYSLACEGWTTRANLLPSDQPLFPASFHDVLTWFVLSEELLRKEKPQLAQAYEQKANDLLSDLRFHLADTHTRELVQGSHPGGHPGGGHPGGGGGGAPSGETNYTQTGLVTYDRDPGPPFAVTPGSAVVPNLDADKVDGLHASALVKHTGANALQQIATFTTGDTITGSPTALLNGGHIQLTSGSPQVTLHNSAAPANARRWGFYVDPGGGGILLMTMTDAGAGILWPFHIERSGLVNLHSVSLSSHIKFPGAQQPSADPNTLDDYREGVFTPFFKSTGGQSGQVYQGFTFAHYVKVGRTVTVAGRIALATLGTFNAGGISIGTLPFASSVQGAVAIGYCVGLAFSSGGVHGWINGAEINLTTWPAGGGTGMGTFPNSWLTATTDIIFGCSYIANS